MKINLILFTLMLVISSVSMTAQSILHKGQKYEVQDSIILINGEDVTHTLSQQDRKAIYIKYNREVESLRKRTKQDTPPKKVEKEQKEAEKAEKTLKKSVKRQKKAEKKQKQAERELKKNEKIQSHYDKTQKNLEKAQKKYDKLKRKDKLSPEDDRKWLNKLEKMKERFNKAEKKLKRA